MSTLREFVVSYPFTASPQWLLISAVLLLLASAACCYDITRPETGPRPTLNSAGTAERRGIG